MAFILALIFSCAIAVVPCTAQTPLIVAHRGASYDAPENTLPAFELAWKQNADAIEGDFYLTKDNQIVCIHDKTTAKYSSVNLSVAKSTLAELRKLDVGAYKGSQFKGTKIPTFREVVDIVPDGKKIYIEIKCGPEIVPFLVKELAESELKKDQIVFISFNAAVIKALKKELPTHKANWLSGVKKQRDGSLKPSVSEVLTTLKRISADGLSSSKDHVTEEYIQSIKQAGYEYHVWTINDVKTASRLHKWGALSITTDRPEFIRTGISD